MEVKYTMPDYKKMYLALFNSITDTIETLQKAQQEVERLAIEADEPKLTILSSKLSSKEDTPS